MSETIFIPPGVWQMVRADEFERLTAELENEIESHKMTLNRESILVKHIAELEAQIRNIDTSDLMNQAERIAKLEGAIGAFIAQHDSGDDATHELELLEQALQEES